ncbi:methionine gamma-lyase [Vulcanibacillus modesticaldus]|uniref:L-methionine gamma-lyase n=1 Tax=Vulcanibacillus modesticaldus TaxID=337097 RepID=A0A1D2YU04_9BACI|nr:methionine gamma-lyase [Vulcanibacillus modesticaldus]OEF99184.1 methionine gamma-lyase [Vulcanibacillus modesticaldus]
MDQKKKMGFSTQAIHAGYSSKEHYGSLTPPIFQTSTFVFNDVEEGRARFSGEQEGYIYTRLGSPTVKLLEDRIAVLEGAEAAVAFGSGMGAVSAVIFSLLKSGDHIIATDAIYGGTYSFFSMIKEKFDIDFTLIDMSNYEEIKKYIRPNTKMIYIETPTNPTMKLVDLEKVAKLSKELGTISVVDNTVMSPYLQRPIDLGIDIVLHSATKYIGGHGDVIAGLVVGRKETMKTIKMAALKNVGSVMSPFDAWLLLRGLKTLSVRLDRHSENAMRIAEYLEQHPKVEKIYYPGLASFPQYELAKKQMKAPGGLLSFEVKGGLQAGIDLLNNVKICKLAVSLGDIDTLIQHPASMTHSTVPIEERLKMGITDGLVRLSVGLEDANDIIADLEQAFSFVK